MEHTIVAPADGACRRRQLRGRRARGRRRRPGRRRRRPGGPDGCASCCAWSRGDADVGARRWRRALPAADVRVWPDAPARGRLRDRVDGRRADVFSATRITRAVFNSVPASTASGPRRRCRRRAVYRLEDAGMAAQMVDYVLRRCCARARARRLCGRSSARRAGRRATLPAQRRIRSRRARHGRARRASRTRCRDRAFRVPAGRATRAGASPA